MYCFCTDKFYVYIGFVCVVNYRLGYIYIYIPYGEEKKIRTNNTELFIIVTPRCTFH